MIALGADHGGYENNRKVKYRCSRSDFIVSGRFFDRGTWNYPEGKGISSLTKRMCDFCVRIPMRGKVSSLNVSVAAALLMYEVVRQRN